MITLTIINTLLIAYLYFKQTGITFGITKKTTFYKETVTGFILTVWKKRTNYYEGIYTLNIPIRNHVKTELAEEIEWMMTDDGKNQKLKAKFSWLKTDKEVDKFKKDYYIVDPEFVQQLVGGYYAKKNSENN